MAEFDPTTIAGNPPRGEAILEGAIDIQRGDPDAPSLDQLRRAIRALALVESSGKRNTTYSTLPRMVALGAVLGMNSVTGESLDNSEGFINGFRRRQTNYGAFVVSNYLNLMKNSHLQGLLAAEAVNNSQS